MVDVVWSPRKFGKPIRITRVNGVAVQLAEVSAELYNLPASFDKYLFPQQERSTAASLLDRLTRTRPQKL